MANIRKMVWSSNPSVKARSGGRTYYSLRKESRALMNVYPRDVSNRVY